MYIVLKTLKKGSIASVLSYEHGKITVHYRCARPFTLLTPGSLIEGDLSNRVVTKYPILRDVRLFCSVVPRGPRAQLFLYLLVEAAYALLPQGEPCSDIFIMLHMIAESGVFSHVDACEALGPSFCLVMLDALGVCPPLNLIGLLTTTRAFLNEYMLECRNRDQPLERSALLPSLLLRYDSVRGVVLDWIAESLREHPQFRKSENVWLGTLHMGARG